jgi:4-diphosphocytidyl-2-C-methyl-D-erythritol kinase
VGDLTTLARSLGNDLAPATKSFVPEVWVLEKELRNSGSPGVTMSGSGTAVFGMFASEAEARAAAEGLRVPFACVCNPVARAVEIL